MDFEDSEDQNDLPFVDLTVTDHGNFRKSTAMENLDSEDLDDSGVFDNDSLNGEAEKNARILLNQAIEMGFLEIVKLLLKQISATTPDSDGNIALHVAVRHDRLDIAKFLLRNNAKEQLTAINHASDTAYDMLLLLENPQPWMAFIKNLQRTQNLQLPSHFLLTDYRVNTRLAGQRIGAIYQLNILAFLSLRIYNEIGYEKARLATEINGLGKLEDVVFENEGLKLMQIKHKSNPENNKIGALFSSAESGDFNLAVYYQSFCSVQKNKKVDLNAMEELIILTNTTISDSYVEYFEEKEVDRNHVLYVEGHAVRRHTLNPMRLDSIREKVFSIPATNYVATNYHIKENFENFAKKLCLITNFPNVQEMQTLITERISGELKIANAKSTFNNFYVKLQNWFVDKRPKAITQRVIMQYMEEIQVDMAVQECIALNKYSCDRFYSSRKCEAHEMLHQFISATTKILQIPTPSLHETSVQIIQNLSCLTSDKFVFISSDSIASVKSQTSETILTAFTFSTFFKVLVVLCEDGRDISEFIETFNKKCLPEMKLILITKRSDATFMGFDSVMWISPASKKRRVANEMPYHHIQP